MTDGDETQHSRPAWLLPSPARPDEPDGSLRSTLLKLMQGGHLSREEARGLLDSLLNGSATDSQIASALVAMAIKGETVDELAGMAEAMRSRAIRIRTRHENFVDTAGTGSSRAKTFNVSTAAAFVIAGAGLPVAKHGSRAATSRSGSADVLTALGVNVSAPPETSVRCLDEIGLCFMFAPLYHGATARVAGIRRELGVHTTFNLLGPLSNPAAAPRQIIGVWHPALAETMARALMALGSKAAWVVHGQDGLDEITLATATSVTEVGPEGIRIFEVTPEDFGLNRTSIDSLQGGNPHANAETINSILEGARRDAARDLVVINAAAALFVGGFAVDLIAAREMAEASIDTGSAKGKLADLIRITNSGSDAEE